MLRSMSTGIAIAASLALVSVVSANAQTGTPANPVTIEVEATLPTHTLFYPASKAKQPLPLIVWENGGCANDPTGVTPLLSELAAHGYFVIAKGFKGGQAPRPPGENASNRAPPPQWQGPTLTPEAIAAGDMPTGQIFPSQGPFSKEPDELMLKAIAWARKQGEETKSRFHGQIDTNRIGLTGYSCGGFTALQVAPLEKSVASVIIFNSGMHPGWTLEQGRELASTFRPGMPVAWINGGTTDIAFVGGQRDWTLVKNTTPSLHAEYEFASNGHGAFYASPASMTKLGVIATNWFDYTLRSGDAKARAYLLDKPCGFCSDALWSVKTKNWDAFTAPAR